MARTKASNHDFKREEILLAAAASFAQLGYAATSMSGLAEALGTSKARLYHYYESKDALLFDLLDGYTAVLLSIIERADKDGAGLEPRARLHLLVREFLSQYQSSAHKHTVLLNDTRHLPPAQSKLVVARQNQLVDAFKARLKRAYPTRFSGKHDTALTMLVFGMINWTFTWLKPDGKLSYAEFAELVIATLERGFEG